MTKTPSSLFVLFCLLALAACDDADTGKSADPPGASCAYPADCPTGDCGPAGVCTDAAACLDYTQCPKADQICVAERCVVRCDTDTDCPVEGHCVEGECKPWTLDLHRNPPHPADATAGDLRAGTAVIDVDPPVGITMAGFGFRAGPSAPLNPYARSMGGSSGMYDRPNVKVITLDNGKERIAIVRMPMCYVTDYVRTAVVKELLDRGRASYEERIVLVSNHSHSYPGRYWRLLPGLGFEAFGYGEFSQSWWSHLVQKTADAVEAAEDDLRDAALAHTVDPNFDPDDRITSDRRSETARFKDPRMTALRIDDVSGDTAVPMAVLVQFAMHGTVMDDERLTGDAGGAVELVAEERLEARSGSPATVLYIQGSAGDVSPRGDRLGHQGPARLELIGQDATDILLPLIDALEPRRDIALAQSDRRVPITRERIGYEEGEFFKIPDGDYDRDAGPFKYGAFQCSREGDDDVGTHWSDGSLDCMFSVELANSRRPISQYSKTLVTALRIGDLIAVTLPGEPASRLGFDLAQTVSTRYGLDMGSVSVWGYAQDHQLYLTPQDDWLQGGYNPSMSVWGFKFGDFIGREAAEAVGAVVDGAEFAPAPEGVHPVWYEELLPDDTVPPTPTPGTPGEVLEDIPERVRRFDVVRMRWRGGHPGASLPSVTLEREDAGAFTTLRWPGEKPYTDAGLRMLVDYLGRWGHKNPADDSPDEHPWELRWEEVADFPPGRYRFVARGRHWTGEAAEPYEAVSRTFELAAATEMALLDPVWTPDAAQGPTLAGWIAYPDSPEDGFRLRSRSARHPLGGPPAAEGFTVSPEGATLTTDDADPNRLGITVRLAAPLGPGEEAAITLTDAHGNSWRWSPEAP